MPNYQLTFLIAFSFFWNCNITNYYADSCDDVVQFLHVQYKQNNFYECNEMTYLLLRLDDDYLFLCCLRRALLLHIVLNVGQCSCYEQMFLPIAGG